ncbi:MAG: aspartate kinase [Chloroflexi bacterium]|nr:aspartate kinase [Chloroflexota bacterium]
MPGEQSKRQATLVMKFGGTSVGNAAAIRQTVETICAARKDWPRLVVVTSAMAGVTNLLLDAASQAVRGSLQAVEDTTGRLRLIHQDAADDLLQGYSGLRAVKEDIDRLVDKFHSLCTAIHVLGEATPRALDTVAAMGERLNVRLLAAAIAHHGMPAEFVEATRLIVTDDQFQDAHPDLELTARRVEQGLVPLLEAGRIPVVTGFIGATREGIVTTLGRGGSDYTAGILGAALGADEVWIMTDVDGVMTADPRWVPEARTIPVLSYREVAELAYFGAKVMHPKTIRPLIDAGIGVRVANTFNPDHPGTRIVAEHQPEGNGKIKAVTVIREQSLITVEGRGMLGVPGVAARTFAAVAGTGTSVPLISQASSEQSICFAVPIQAAEQVVAELEREFARELERRDIDRIWASEEVYIITVVGAGMKNTYGIAGRIFSALGEAKANVIAIAQGSSEVSISMIVSTADGERAVRAVHQLIVKE